MLSKKGGWLEMAGKIDDSLLEKIAVVGLKHELADKLKSRYGGWAHRLSLVSYNQADDWTELVQELRS